MAAAQAQAQSLVVLPTRQAQVLGLAPILMPLLALVTLALVTLGMTLAAVTQELGLALPTQEVEQAQAQAQATAGQEQVRPAALSCFVSSIPVITWS